MSQLSAFHEALSGRQLSVTSTNSVTGAGSAVGAFAKPIKDAAVLNVGAVLHRRRLGKSAFADAIITDYDPLDPATAANPFPAYRKLHQGDRVHYNPRRATWIISRHNDLREALKATEQINSTEGVTRIKFAMPFLVFTDGEQHSQLRKKVQPAFTKRALESWTPMIDDLAKTMVADVIANPGCDVVRRLTIPMPMSMIAHILGVPDADIAQFRCWSENAVKIMDLAPNLESVGKSVTAVRAVFALRSYLLGQFRHGALKDSDTALGRLVNESADGPITDDELFAFALLLLAAGNETTTNLLGGIFDTLARNPDQYDKIRENPELIPMAVEEQLRYSSPIQHLYRNTVAGYTVGDVTIPRGSRVLMSYGAANRDPRVFENPDAYIADRNPRMHVAFGYGAHMCLGAPLARLEAQAVLRELVQNVKRIEPVSDTTWSTNASLRGPTHLCVRLKGA
ncbi:cytochrome P450 [Mycobacterium sp. E2479]|uniref:cytochrome P450 n=1 Tax=Mycobacterium sp. E2479 TaxID=1834134 RepID=UPI0009EE2D37|nr:cytochrome P450 [Mycobacterium sp. E2479]